MKVHQLQYLIVVADKGSVRAAAQASGLSAAAISRGLSELEDSLGAQLLVRQSMGAALTEAGRELVVRARSILSGIEEATREVQRGRRQEGSTLSVGVTPWLGESLLPDVITAFRRVQPETRVMMAEILGNSHEGLRDGIFDLALGLSPAADTADEFREMKLFCYGEAVICRKGHPLAHARSLEQLRGATWVLSREVLMFPSPLKEILQEALDDRQSVRVHIARSHRIVDCLVASTDMLSLCPWPKVEATEVREQVHALNLHDFHTEYVVSVLTRRNVALSRDIKQFIRCLSEVMEQASSSPDPTARRVFSVMDWIDVPRVDRI